MTRSLLSALFLALAMPASSQTFVVNQGNFSDGNGSVTVLPNRVENSATQRYEGQLGSILQSGVFASSTGNLYLIANSANRIDIIDPVSGSRLGQIEGGLSSPRYLGIVPGTGTGYITNQVYTPGQPSFVMPTGLLFQSNGTINVFRPGGNPIEVDGLPETVAVLGDSAYVALGSGGAAFGGSDSLAVLDVTTDALAGYIDLDCYARFVITSLDDVLVFCESTNEMLVLDTENRGIAQRLPFGEAIGDPFSVGQTVGYGPQVYFLRSASATSPPPNYVITASGVARVGKTAAGPYEIEAQIAIPEVDTRPVSAIAFTGFHIALGRPDPSNPFTADGTITLHNPETGTLVATYPAGIYPAHIVPSSAVNTAAEQEAAARNLNLELAGPNPARGTSALAFTLRQPEDAHVTVHDLLGRTVATVADRAFGAGEQRVELDVSGLTPGPYRVRLSVGDRVASLPLTVVR